MLRSLSATVWERLSPPNTLDFRDLTLLNLLVPYSQGDARQLGVGVWIEETPTT